MPYTWGWDTALFLLPVPMCITSQTPTSVLKTDHTAEDGAVRDSQQTQPVRQQQPFLDIGRLRHHRMKQKQMY
jgi:hypothetical protein